MTARSRRSNGSVRKLTSGKYQARYKAPDDTYRSLGTFDTKKAADAAVAAVLTDVSRGAWTDDRAGLVPFDEYVERVIPLLEWAPRTMETNRSIIRRHLSPTFGHVHVRDITRHMVGAWHASMQPTTGPVALRNAYFVLSRIMKEAIQDDLIKANPCQLVKAGRDASKARPDFTVKEFTLVVEQLPEALQPVLWLAFGAHLRLGEIVALRRGDLDLESGVLRVERQIQNVGGRAVTMKTKTGNSRRVALLPMVVDKMTEYLQEHPRLPYASMFDSPRGGELKRNYLSAQWTKARDAAGLPEFHLHDVRHVSLSLVAQNASMREVMARGGHRTTAAALRYQHALEQRDSTVAAAAGLAFQRAMEA
jgi:integrase